MTTSSYRVRTKAIGDELARLIQVTSLGATLKVCQYRGIEQVAAPLKLVQLLPCAFVEPFPRTEYRPLDMAGSESDVRDTFRIACFYKVDATEDLQQTQEDTIEALLAGLTVDITLSNIGAAIRPDQVTWSGLVGIDWAPEEALFLTDTSQPAQVVVLEWAVSWLNRG